MVDVIRYYRLRKTAHNSDHVRTKKLHRLLKFLDLSSGQGIFSGEDPILIFEFLTRMVEKFDTLGMSEGQTLIDLPHFLSDSARCKVAQEQVKSLAGRKACSIYCKRQTLQGQSGTQQTSCEVFLRPLMKMNSRTARGITTNLTAVETPMKKMKNELRLSGRNRYHA